MATRQYIGARYVPKFADPIEWDSVRSYEALTIVTHFNSSYTSKKPVPVGVDISNTEYWVNTGNYNQQIEEYRQDVENLDMSVRGLSNTVGQLYLQTNELAEELENLNAYLKGKTIKIFGDSISTETATSQYQLLQPNWVAKLRERVPSDCIVDNTYSLAGRFITGNQGIADVMNHLTADEMACDILIIFAGVNDYRWSRELINGTDNNYATLRGALNMIRSNIMSKVPTANVFIVSPLREFHNELAPYPADHNDYMPLILYRNSMYTWASNNGFTFIDGFSAPMLNPANGTMLNLYQKDGLHPNTDYAGLLCEYIYSKIVNNHGVNPGKETVRINISSLVDSAFTSVFAYADLDEKGNCHLTVSVTGTLTAGTNATIMTLPIYFRGLTTGSTFALCSGSQNVVQAVTISSVSGAVSIRPNVSGTFTISLDYTFPLNVCNRIFSASV